MQLGTFHGRRTFVLVVLTLVVCQSSLAQSNFRLKEPKIGMTLATNGIGLSLGVASNKPILLDKSQLLVSIQTIKGANETKIQNSLFTNPKSYILGKKNVGATVRLGFQTQKYIGAKTPNSPRISYGLILGPSMGITKPYYIAYQDIEDQNSSPLIVPQTEERANDPENIAGPANWTNGLNELQFTPSIHTGLSLNINWDRTFFFMEWTIGARYDYFPNGLQLNVNGTKNHFASIYTTYSIGKR